MEAKHLIYEHRNKLYTLCLYLERNTFYADELFQDTWVKAIEHMASYNRNEAFYPWLSQIAVNLYRDRLRRLKRELKLILWSNEEHTYITKDNLDLEANLLKNEQYKLLRHCLCKLDDKYKLPIVLVYQENLSYAEISRILDLKESTVKSRIYDGKQRLKKMLEKEGFCDISGIR